MVGIEIKKLVNKEDEEQIVDQVAMTLTHRYVMDSKQTVSNDFDGETGLVATHI